MMIEIAGWAGFVLILLSYFGLTQLRFKTQSFHTLNLLGGVCLMLNAAAHGSVPLAALNAVYATIAAWGLTRRKAS